MRFLSSIKQVSEAVWDSLWATDYPFVQHRFLRILEETHCTTTESGWEPFHLVVEENGRLLFAMVLYRKHHSYGEYVFDWGWADAVERAGLPYYPKLLSSIPFTPATGPRLAFDSNLAPHEVDRIGELVFSRIKTVCHERGYSSFHLLFPCAQTRKRLEPQRVVGQIEPQRVVGQIEPQRVVERQGHQFHWFNRGYSSFDDFLSTFNSRKRKNINRERRKVHESGVALRFVLASELTLADWGTFFLLYHRTYLKRSGRPGYLTEAFFRALGEAFPQQVLICWAEQVGEPHSSHNVLGQQPSSNLQCGEKIAASLYFRDDTTLYGRYWGAREEFDGLHFEACYYQGIEYAISQGLQRFDPGAQGEHKIQRGFVPIKTSSFHWMAHPDFHRAVAEFVEAEQSYNLTYIHDCRKMLPFKDGVAVESINCLL